MVKIGLLNYSGAQKNALEYASDKTKALADKVDELSKTHKNDTKNMAKIDETLMQNQCSKNIRMRH